MITLVESKNVFSKQFVRGSRLVITLLRHKNVRGDLPKEYSKDVRDKQCQADM